MEQPIVVKRIEAQLSLNASHQDSSRRCELEELIPSPTMPPLEDPDMWHRYSEFDAAEAFLPVEIRAKVVQTFLLLWMHSTACCHFPYFLLKPGLSPYFQLFCRQLNNWIAYFFAKNSQNIDNFLKLPIIRENIFQVI